MRTDEDSCLFATGNLAVRLQMSTPSFPNGQLLHDAQLVCGEIIGRELLSSGANCGAAAVRQRRGTRTSKKR